MGYEQDLAEREEEVKERDIRTENRGHTEASMHLIHLTITLPLNLHRLYKCRTVSIWS